MNMYAADEKNDVIGPEGMEKLCEDIGVEPENVCWHFFHFYHEYLQSSLYLTTVYFCVILEKRCRYSFSDDARGVYAI